MNGRRRSNSRGLIGAILVVLALVAVVAALFLWPRGSAEQARRPAPAAQAVPNSQLRGQDVPPLDLPELSASDEFVRNMAVSLSEHPRLAAWLVNDELVYRFVRTTVNLAYGQSPSEHVEFLRPEGEFQVQDTERSLVIDPASYQRYDLLTATFTSLDTEGTATLYRQLYPLFEEAFAELGVPDVTFDGLFAQALDNLLAVDVPTALPEVAPSSAVYAFTDGDLEARTPAAKHLMRMGPENAFRLQDKLRELKATLWIQ